MPRRAYCVHIYPHTPNPHATEWMDGAMPPSIHLEPCLHPSILITAHPPTLGPLPSIHMHTHQTRPPHPNHISPTLGRLSLQMSRW